MQIGKKELTVRNFFEQRHNGEVPTDKTVQQLYTEFMTTGADANVSYGLFNGVIKKLKAGITTTYIAMAINDIHLDAYLVNNHPAMGRETKEPIGNPIKTVPNSASDN